VDEDCYRSTHSLQKIYSEIRKVDEEFSVSRKDLAFLTDFYFDARYPGSNYIDVTQEDCERLFNSEKCVGEEVVRIERH